MSQPKRMTFTSREVGGGQTSKTEWVLLEDYELLKAEVERLRASSFVTAVPVEEYEKLKAEVERLHKYVETMERESMSDEYDINHQTRIINGLLTDKERLQAEVERLRKAGDAMAECILKDCIHKNDVAALRWYDAKEGKQP